VALIERDALLSSLRARLDDASGGWGQLVWVAGEAGAGKSSAIRAFCDGLDPSVEVWWGACDPLTTARPLGPLLDVAVSGTALAEAIGHRPAHEVFLLARQQLQHAVGPVVFVIEDAHWADGPTCDMIRFLGRRLSNVKALLVVTYRDDEVGPDHPLRVVLGDLAAAPSVSRLRVPALSRTAVSELAADHGLDGSQVYAMTGGNAFFVSEVVAARSPELPQTVSDAVLARAARLPPSARQALDAASVNPVAFEPRLLEAAVRAADVDVDACVTMGLLVPDGHLLRFRHEIARLSVEAALPPARRRQLHELMLGLLASEPGTDAARLAHHALGWGDAQAVVHYASAAAAAAVRMGAHREAAGLYTAVLLQSAALPAEQRADLLERRSYEYYLTGQVDQAVASREGALALARQAADQRRIGDNLRWLSRLAWFDGRTDLALVLGHESVAVLEQQPPGHELAMAYSNLAQLGMLRAGYADAELWGQKALALAAQLGDLEVTVHALNNVGTSRYLMGDPSGRAQLERSLALALENGLEEHAARAYTNLLSVAVTKRDVAGATDTAEKGLTYCRERDLDSWTLYMNGWRARLALDVDDWEQAERAASEVLRRPDATPVSAINAKAVMARLRARRGQPGALVLADQAIAAAVETNEPQRLSVAFAAAAEVRWVLGKQLPEVVQSRAAQVAQDSDAWEAHELAVWAMRHGLRLPAQNHHDPYLQSLRGDHAAAAQAWLGQGCRYEAALAALDSSDPDLIRRGVDWLRQLGADGVLDRANARLRDVGVRGPRASTAQNPAGLTDREAEVLALLAEGLSNAAIAARLVLSKRTVDHHVSAVLRKLNVTTRAEAVRWATQSGYAGRPT